MAGFETHAFDDDLGFDLPSAADDSHGFSLPSEGWDSGFLQASHALPDPVLERDGFALPSLLDKPPPGEMEFNNADLDGVGPEESMMHPTVIVPTPSVAKHIVLRQDAAEYYSPPRLLRAISLLGFIGCLSLDLITGWNFQLEELQRLSIFLLGALHIRFLLLCPPCTVFSELQRLWNIKRMDPAAFRRKWEEGVLYVRHAMMCALAQHQAKRFFVFEHPARASSWALPDVQHVASLPGVYEVIFDQCMVGLVSKVTQTPMRKRTKLLTNSSHIYYAFSNLMCNGRHQHQTIQGSEGGVRRSTWAQIYPQPMVDLLAKGVQLHCQSEQP